MRYGKLLSVVLAVWSLASTFLAYRSWAESGDLRSSMRSDSSLYLNDIANELELTRPTLSLLISGHGRPEQVLGVYAGLIRLSTRLRERPELWPVRDAVLDGAGTIAAQMKERPLEEVPGILQERFQGQFGDLLGILDALRRLGAAIGQSGVSPL